MRKTVKIYSENIEFILEIFHMSWKDFLVLLNSKFKNRRIKKEDILTENIELTLLKKIDVIFGKGLSFYSDHRAIKRDKKSSIFLRKEVFNANLRYQDIQVMNKLEKDINYLNALRNQSKFKIGRRLPEFSARDKAAKVGLIVHELLGIDEVRKSNDDKGFLKAVIDLLADKGVVVLEFVDDKRGQNKTILEGCFIAPNYIGLKRQPKKFLKREIFTLAHELGHYLLSNEELDKGVLSPHDYHDEKIENWCNEFAFHFLLGKEIEKVENVGTKELNHDDDYVAKLAKEMHISRLAIFTHLYVSRKINGKKYGLLTEGLSKKHSVVRSGHKTKSVKRKPRSKALASSNSNVIYSNLHKNIYRHAYFEGVIDKYDILLDFDLEPSNSSVLLDKFLYG